MSGADRLEDGYPHGTVEGYAQGCRGGWCPAGNEHGLSCRKAKQLAAADYQFQRLVKAGRSPFEIAFELGLMPETHGVPARKKAARVADEVDEVDEEEVGPVDEQGSEQQGGYVPGEVEREVIVGGSDKKEAVVPLVKFDGFEKFVKPKNRPPAPTSSGRSKAELAEIRAWAKENGVPHTVTGRMPRATIEAYDAAHAPVVTEFTDPVAITSERILPFEAVAGDLPEYDPTDPGPHEAEATGVPTVEDLEGATLLPLEFEEIVDAGQFAAVWNAKDAEGREGLARRLVENARAAFRCFVQDHAGAVWLMEHGHGGSWDRGYAEGVAAAEAALGLALRKWAAEQDRRKGQSRLIRSLAAQVIAAEYERRSDAEVLAGMDRAYADALARIDELQAEVLRLRGPWWKRGAA